MISNQGTKSHCDINIKLFVKCFKFNDSLSYHTRRSKETKNFSVSASKNMSGMQIGIQNRGSVRCV